jgi:branched-chain amino acid aminotransferase
MGTAVSINGTLVAPEDARVSVFDRGFLYGDSVYEVVRTYKGVPFELEKHLARLESSAARIHMALPASLDEIRADIAAAHVASGNDDSYVRVVVTRGAGPIGLDPAMAIDPLRIVVARELSPPPPEAYADGVKIALVSVRRNLRSAIDPAAKTGNYLNSVMALAEARERGAHEAVMLDHRDYVTEGASSNVFAVMERAVLTPPLDAGILEGVTRGVVFEVARRAGLRVIELPLTEAALEHADEVFITSSIREIVPVVRVDDRVVGSGRPGPVYKRIRQLFDEYVEQYVLTHRPRARSASSAGAPDRTS